MFRPLALRPPWGCAGVQVAGVPSPFLRLVNICVDPLECTRGALQAVRPAPPGRCSANSEELGEGQRLGRPGSRPRFQVQTLPVTGILGDGDREQIRETGHSVPDLGAELGLSALGEPGVFGVGNSTLPTPRHRSRRSASAPRALSLPREVQRQGRARSPEWASSGRGQP